MPTHFAQPNALTLLGGHRYNQLAGEPNHHHIEGSFNSISKPVKYYIIDFVREGKGYPVHPNP